MSEENFNSVRDLFAERIAAGDFPSAVFLAADRGETRFISASGLAVKTDEIEIAAQVDTIYDLASLTKPLVTGLLVARLIERGEIKLNDAVKRFFSGFDTVEKQRLTVRDLLTHVSGFAAWKPFYFFLNESRQNIENTKAEILAAVGLEDLRGEPRARVVYSDLNFVLLGFLLEKLHGKSLDQIAETEIFAPLDLRRTFFNPPPEIKEETAASEFGNEYEKQMCREMGYFGDSFAWRDRLIWGEVHDANCYFMNGVSGHAGLFSNAEETFRLAAQFLPATTQLLKPETCELFRANLTRNLNEARSIAFELAATKDSTAGARLAPDSFGHLGFAGTSLWIEPSTERIFVLLTNRTHRALPFVNINSTRRKFHDLATDALNGTLI